jgi:hypothetical protein
MVYIPCWVKLRQAIITESSGLLENT